MIGSRWRKLTCTRQALLVLAHLRCGDTYARLAARFGVGVATVYRYVTELVDLFAARGTIRVPFRGRHLPTGPAALGCISPDRTPKSVIAIAETPQMR